MNSLINSSSAVLAILVFVTVTTSANFLYDVREIQINDAQFFETSSGQYDWMHYAISSPELEKFGIKSVSINGNEILIAKNNTNQLKRVSALKNIIPSNENNINIDFVQTVNELRNTFSFSFWGSSNKRIQLERKDLKIGRGTLYYDMSSKTISVKNNCTILSERNDNVNITQFIESFEDNKYCMIARVTPSSKSNLPLKCQRVFFNNNKNLITTVGEKGKILMRPLETMNQYEQQAILKLKNDIKQSNGIDNQHWWQID